ncbi:hypothetical protein Q0F98_13880 [Paenibacillus amylolyticus]|nr:hypothetical protein Q0F98_13880 [Paenibacillus amylolyticus]
MFTVGFGIPLLVFMQMFMYAMYKIFGWDIPFNLLWLCNHWMSRLGWLSVGHFLLALVLLTFAGTGWLLTVRMMKTRAAIRNLPLHGGACIVLNWSPSITISDSQDSLSWTSILRLHLQLVYGDLASYSPRGF